MLTGGLIPKDPDAEDWPQVIDWTDQLAEWDANEEIATSTWAISPSGLTEETSTIVTGNKQTQIKLSGGTLGRKYTVTNHITTTSGIEDERSFTVRIQNL